MNTHLDQAYEQENLQQAWQWILTNPESHLKSYFRNIYREYSLAQDKHLLSLQSKLKRNIFRPTHVTKFHFPKKSVRHH